MNSEYEDIVEPTPTVGIAFSIVNRIFTLWLIII